MNEQLYQVLGKKKEQVASKKPRLSTEEFVAQMKAKREELYEMANSQVNEIVSDPQKYLRYLNIQSKLDYTVTNTLLIMKQCPNATYLKDSAHWRENKCYIRKGEEGISILEPEEYTKSDGTLGTSYKPKKVFDVSQLSTKIKIDVKAKPDIYDLMSGLTYDSPVNVQVMDHFNGITPVYYSPESKTIFVENNLEQDVLLQGLAREFCYAECDFQYGTCDHDKDRLLAESASYILCQKYGIPVSDKGFANEVKDYFRGADSKDIKKELTAIKNLYDDVSKRVERGIYKAQHERLPGKSEVSR